ncbi:MAG: ribonuclease HII [Spirochaetales bacterium]|nr:ribonuclease HII [Spirochaetales bacterium]
MKATIVCGFDEAGRGPLCGPVTGAAVILPPGFDITGIRDSKKLSQKARDAAALRIYSQARWGLGWTWPKEIDEMNIHRASLLAMERAWGELTTNFWLPEDGDILFLVDGKFCPPNLLQPCKALVGGDDLEPAISAASILAKTARDRWMDEWVYSSDPQDTYGILHHKGYPTALHRRRLEIHGPSSIHRLSFRGVKQKGTSKK